MKHVKHLDRITDNPIEDQIVTIYPAAYTQMFISRDACMPPGGVGQRFTSPPKFLHERQGTRGIVPGNPITDRFKISLSRTRDNNDHQDLAANFRSSASRRSHPFDNGFTRSPPRSLSLLELSPPAFTRVAPRLSS